MRVSFLHLKSGDKPFLTVHEHFRAVRIKYFKQIFLGTFNPAADLLKLSDTHVRRTSGDDHEISDMGQLLRCFEVYGQVICDYAHPDVAFQLQKALSDYRIRLYDMSVWYTFVSLREYHYSFMIGRILHGQDDPVAWITEDIGRKVLLIRKDAHLDSVTQPFYSEDPEHPQFEDDQVDY